MLHSLSGRAESQIQSRLLTLLRDEGPLSKPQVADALGVSRTTVAAEAARLVERGLAQEAGPAKSRGGRRSTLLDLSDSVRFVGIDIGATRVNVGVTDGRLAVLAKAEIEANLALGPEVVLEEALGLVNKLLIETGVERPTGVGIGVPGPVDFDRGVPIAPPLMPGWDGYPVRDAVARELGCPAVLDNDVNLLAVGESQAGVARRSADFLFVKIGTGIGCGMVVGGQIFRGVNGCAGDVGHIRIQDDGPLCNCGNTGCLEAYAGGAALERAAREAAESGRSPVLEQMLAERGNLSAECLGDAILRGDAVALALLRDAGRRVGQVLASLISFFNPGMIVMGGRVTQLGHTLLAEVRSEAYRRSLPLATGTLPIVHSELPGDGGLIGAARLISDSVYAPYSK